jgi:hypothetical protein
VWGGPGQDLEGFVWKWTNPKACLSLAPPAFRASNRDIPQWSQFDLFWGQTELPIANSLLSDSFYVHYGWPPQAQSTGWTWIGCPHCVQCVVLARLWFVPKWKRFRRLCIASTSRQSSSLFLIGGREDMTSCHDLTWNNRKWHGVTCFNSRRKSFCEFECRQKRNFMGNLLVNGF